MPRATVRVRFELNGAPVDAAVDPDRTLLDWLRNDRQLRATRFGCGLGQCGACTVAIDDVAAPACNSPLWTVAGKHVTTLEGLGSRAVPHPLQTAFIEEQALQCGFCTSGLLMAAATLLKRNPQPDRQQIQAALQGNLCRCGVHNRVIRAIGKVAGTV
ncbi:MAG: (2Fe-2S)-binding protein [Burkholderiales bacterium]